MPHANSIGFSQTVNLQSDTFCQVGRRDTRKAREGSRLAQRLPPFQRLG